MYPSSQTSSPRSEAVALHGPKDSSTLVPVRSEVVGRRVKEEWAEQIRASYSLKQSYLALQSSASAYEKEATHQEWTDLLKIKAEMSELAELAESSNSKKAREVGHAESADGLAKFTTVALEYSKMLDVVMNQSPEYAALIWGTIRMLLVAHTNHSKLKHDVQYYLIKFGQDFGVVNQLTNTHPTLRVVECVTEAYTAFSEFLAKTVKFYIESRLTSVFEGFGFPWETRFQQLVTRIETAFQRIREIAQTEHFSLTGQTQTEIRSTGQETIDLRKHLELEMKNEVQGLFETFAKNWISRFEQLLMESKQDRGTPPNLHEAENFSTGPYSVIESTKWTAEQAPRSHHRVGLNARRLKTFLTRTFPNLQQADGDDVRLNTRLRHVTNHDLQVIIQLLRNESLSTCLPASSSGLIWINTFPNSRIADWGTAFAVRMVEYAAKVQEVTVLRHFCGNHPSAHPSSSPTVLLQSLIMQLLRQHHKKFTRKAFPFTRANFRDSRDNIEDLWGLFRSCCTEAEAFCIWIIIDHIDNLPKEDDYNSLIQRLQTLSKEICRVFKVIVTARTSGTPNSINDAVEADPNSSCIASITVQKVQSSTEAALLSKRKRSVKLPDASPKSSPWRADVQGLLESSEEDLLSEKETEMENQTLYCPLMKKRSTRFLYLQPGSNGNSIVCKLVSEDVDNMKQQYEALSYVWGSQSVKRTIYCMGREFQIGLNAYGLLRQLRYPDKVRILWLDAIVINQADPYERSSQVFFMHEIFRNARDVLIWLGEEDNFSNLAMEYTAQIQPAELIDEAAAEKGFWVPSEYQPTHKSCLFDRMAHTPENKTLIQALIALVERPWLTRVWVQQEATFCLNTHVLCGTYQITWDQYFALCQLFRRADAASWPEWIEYKYVDIKSSLIAARYIQRHRFTHQEDLYYKYGQGNYSISNDIEVLITGSQMCQASDPRDKIYALYNLAGNLHAVLAPPPIDYHISWETLYINFAKWLYQTGWILTLHSAGRSQQKDVCLPSWAPDWRHPPNHCINIHDTWSAGGYIDEHHGYKFIPVPKKLAHRLQLTDSQSAGDGMPKRISRISMSLPCILQDRVIYVGGICQEWTGYTLFPQIYHIVDKLEQDGFAAAKVHITTPYMTGETREDAYASTLVANTTHEDKIASATFCNGYKDWRNWIMEGDLRNPPLYHNALWSSNAFTELQFCITAHGFLCLGPAMCKTDDCVAIISGYPVPLVLHPIGQYYEVIGDCYVHGMMESQAPILIHEYKCKYVPDATNQNPTNPNTTNPNPNSMNPNPTYPNSTNTNQNSMNPNPNSMNPNSANPNSTNPNSMNPNSTNTNQNSTNPNPNSMNPNSTNTNQNSTNLNLTNPNSTNQNSIIQNSMRSRPARLLGANYGDDDYSSILHLLGKRWINII